MKSVRAASISAKLCGTIGDSVERRWRHGGRVNGRAIDLSVVFVQNTNRGSMIFQLGTYNRQVACQAVGLFRCGVLAFQDHSALFAAFSSNYDVEVKARHSGHISLNSPSSLCPILMSSSVY